MSRNTLILVVVLCAGIAGLIAFSKMRSGQSSTTAAPDASGNTAAPAPGTTPGQSTLATQRRATGARPINAAPNTTPNTAPLAGTETVPPGISSPNSIARTTIAAANPASPGLARLPIQVATNLAEDPTPPKTLPALESDYATTTNRDTRLDIMMDIADMPGGESIKALTRLFQLETDQDLKVDLIDSLLGIDGFKEEKLIMLTMGAQIGLPAEVRQSAIDGLIDLDDRRVIPVLNGLLNDPDPEIREGAKDALEMIQSQPAPVKFK